MELCDKISSQFHVPLLFWTMAGWNANGFFGSVDDPIADLELRSHSESEALGINRPGRETKLVRLSISLSYQKDHSQTN
jgi:hypothetical protein